MSSWSQFQLQDSATPTMMMLTSFHDLILMTMVLILTIISYMLTFIMLNKFSSRTLKEAHKIEFIWTIMPASILLLLATPSLQLLYLMEESTSPALTIKAIGHQWYWDYEYGDFQHIKYNSYMINSDFLKFGEPRLLEVDNRLIVPMQTEVRLLTTASDVIHSWTIPSLGIKTDAIPGRLNQLSFSMNRAGVFYGQCSEICGANHSFMPIVLESINMKSFTHWSKTYK